MTSLVSANAPSLMATPPSALCRIEVVVSLGCSRLPLRNAAALRAMNSSCSAWLAATVPASALAHAASSSQMNTMYSAISGLLYHAPAPAGSLCAPRRPGKILPACPDRLGDGPAGVPGPSAPPPRWVRSRAGDIADLDADPMPQAGAATGQTGGFVSGSDHDVPRQDRGRRIAAILAAHGAHRAHLVSHVGDRSAKTRKPGTPLLALIRPGHAVGLAAEGEDVLAHDLFPSAGPARLAGLYPFVNRRSAASTATSTKPPVL